LALRSPKGEVRPGRWKLLEVPTATPIKIYKFLAGGDFWKPSPPPP